MKSTNVEAIKCPLPIDQYSSLAAEQNPVFTTCIYFTTFDLKHQLLLVKQYLSQWLEKAFAERGRNTRLGGWKQQSCQEPMQRKVLNMGKAGETQPTGTQKHIRKVLDNTFNNPLCPLEQEP